MAETAVTNAIIAYVVNGLQTGLSMTGAQIYPSIIPAYIPGQNPQIVQVVAGPVQNLDETPIGAQAGGCQLYRFYFDCVYWLRLQIDMPYASADMLQKASIGQLDFMRQLRSQFEFTYLGNPTTGANLSVEPVRFENETGSIWSDEDSGVVQRTMTFSCVFGFEMGDTQTM